MYDPVFLNRLAQVIYAERLAEAEQARRRRRAHHQPRWQAHFARRAGLCAAALLIAAGRRLQAQAARSLVQTA